MGKKLRTHQLLLFGLCGIALAAGFLTDNRTVSVNSAFATNTTGNCPPPSGNVCSAPNMSGGCYQYPCDCTFVDGAGNTHSCGENPDGGGTTAPMPPDIPTVEEPTQAPQPTPTPSANPPGGTSGGSGGTPTPPPTRAQMLQQMKNACNPNPPPTTAQRNTMLNNAFTDLIGAIQNPNGKCRWLLGPQTIARSIQYALDGTSNAANDPHDPLNVISDIRTPGKITDQVGAMVSQTADATCSNFSNRHMNLYDIFFGMAAAYVNVSTDPQKPDLQWATDLTDAQVTQAFQQRTFRCSSPVTTTHQRAETLAHEIGHMTSSCILGWSYRHGGNGLTQRQKDYDAAITTACGF